ncbi:AhpD family alkylhydroperoxidase [Arthrobacter silviterrae]|uniref:Carboxymuconolactone decarboxylase family protein n=1 Tax=Arthrobacter silviterrae TaxID=2026658 RepID=A0ABX0D7A5_9MICC|nr:carboxymuconolactone decarboxylase family protein [Arthrobacter silviterrae]MDQ0276974.1 AhpD family alkylhydroperoxidase [Arthrobacter silviterrae]NGN82762.1 carboxymuconolactone decarboxylase family protein [Arthrobacter silviterrae]
MSTQRMNIQEIDPKAYQPMYAMEKYIHGGTLGEDLLALVKIRASQLNGCAYCLDMHGREARNAGVDNRRLDVLAGWHEAPELYSERERAALALTEAVTLISNGGVTDSTWSRVKSAFDDAEVPVLLMAISAINVWNRLAVSTHQKLPLPAELAGP